MSKIVDFKCTYDNSVGINEEVTKKLQLSFPDAYKHHNTMVLIAKELCTFQTETGISEGYGMILEQIEF